MEAAAAGVARAHPVEHTTQLALHEKAKLKKSLRRFDMLFFLLCAFVGLDTLGLVASSGGQGFTWLIVLARRCSCCPYALVMAEVGSAFTQEGGPYEWTKLAFGRFHAGLAAVFYWVTNPLWVGGSLAFVAADGVEHEPPFRRDISAGSFGDYVFKLLFVWFSIGVAIASLSRGKWIPTAGGIARVIVLGFFTVTVVALRRGARRARDHVRRPEPDAWPSSSASCPYLLFNYVGLRAAQRRRGGDGQPAARRPRLGDPQRDRRRAHVRDPGARHPAGAAGERHLGDRRLHRRDPDRLRVYGGASERPSSTSWRCSSSSR